jgi:hypothetical protein
MVVALLFGLKSHVTWFELKTFGRFVQAKKRKKSAFSSDTPWRGLTSREVLSPSEHGAVHNPERFSLRHRPQDF